MKKKLKEPNPIFQNFYLEMERMEVNRNRTPYIKYKVMQYREGRLQLLGYAICDLSDDLNHIGIIGHFELKLRPNPFKRCNG